jgi:galactose mutarotase-like enzyme
MKYLLENDQLLVEVKEQGAELSSLRNKQTGLEYLWQADPAVWARHAPVLFPIVGKLKDNTYRLNGNSYSMSQHGFARDMDWVWEEGTGDKLVFSLKENQETLQQYPFFFELRAIYALEGDLLSVSYEVLNRSDEEMPFSIGAHPGFRCPLQEEERYEDYYLEFEKPEELNRQFLKGGLRTGKSRKLPLQEGRELPLKTELFKNDAIVVEGVKSNWLSLRSRAHPHGLRFEMEEGFPYLGIWTKPGNRQFICIEPWHGVADREEGQEDIRQKEGINLLPTGKSFRCTYKIRVF